MKGESQELPFLWVDAICINQNDVIEQGIQVKRMGMIYSSAETVIVWIGAPRIESDAPALREILLNLDWTRKNAGFRSLDSAWPVWSEDYSARLYFYHLDSNCAVSPVTIRDGAFKAMRRISIINNVRISRARGLKVRLTQLLCLDRLSFCSDPRDRINALLGLAEEQDNVSPDYTKPVQWVLQDAVESLIKRKIPKYYLYVTEASSNGWPAVLDDPDKRHLFMASGTMLLPEIQLKAGVLSTKGLILDIVDGMGAATPLAQSNTLKKPTLPFCPAI
ncbi:hypothetical protein BPAE_0046g00380 [Botrytis paeoniae]|uniref:Heterokaryon incompatibility domain-containing protein n=1 Tax=Botrytis paeoniae TaxID=278948 RepID=A0A4Z1FRP5_9HELO|nr:hypothetical protein BPAE_0046g00380 [Botrytis paeoniae]